MNTYEAAKRLYGISDEIEVLSDKMQKSSKIDDKRRIEKEIDALEVEFFKMKHQMQKISIIIK